MEKVTKKMVWCGAGPYGVGWCGAMVVEINTVVHMSTLNLLYMLRLWTGWKLASS